MTAFAQKGKISFDHFSQPAITCSKLTIETLEQRCEICSKLTIKPPNRFGGFIANFEHILHLCSSAPIANFEQVNAGWVTSFLFSSK